MLELKFPINVLVEVKVTPGMIDSIIVGALEGGIHAWCSAIKITKQPIETLADVGINHAQYLEDNHGIDFKEATRVLLTRGEVSFCCLEDGNWYPIRIRDLTGAIETWMYNKRKIITAEDMGNLDASAMDEIIQLAVFDEVVY